MDLTLVNTNTPSHGLDHIIELRQLEADVFEKDVYPILLKTHNPDEVYPLEFFVQSLREGSRKVFVGYQEETAVTVLVVAPYSTSGVLNVEYFEATQKFDWPKLGPIFFNLVSQNLTLQFADYHFFYSGRPPTTIVTEGARDIFKDLGFSFLGFPVDGKYQTLIIDDPIDWGSEDRAQKKETRKYVFMMKTHPEGKHLSKGTDVSKSLLVNLFQEFGVGDMPGCEEFFKKIPDQLELKKEFVGTK